MFTRERLTRWTAALRANPEQQMGGYLVHNEDERFCCLGKLCQVEGLPLVCHLGDGGYLLRGFQPRLDQRVYRGVLPPQLASEFGGGDCFEFYLANMPPIVTSGGGRYASAVSANDGGVSWLTIADHFDKHYPCSDEVKA